jgi:hypothetical protein
LNLLIQTMKAGAWAHNTLGVARTMSASSGFWPKSMAIQTTRKEDYWGHVDPVFTRFMMKRSVLNLRWLSRFHDVDTVSLGFSTPTVPACTWMTGGWCRTLQQALSGAFDIGRKALRRVSA